MSGRSFLDRLKSGEWWAEQAAHGWMGGGISIVVQAAVKATGGSQWWSGIIAAALLMALYETIQNAGDDDNNVPDSVADWFFGTLGGVLVAIPAMVG